MADVSVQNYFARAKRDATPPYLPPYPWMGGRRMKFPETLEQIEKRVNHAITDWERTRYLGYLKEKQAPIRVMPWFQFPTTMAGTTYYWPTDEWMDRFGDRSAYEALLQDPNVKWCFHEDIQREIVATGIVFGPSGLIKECK